MGAESTPISEVQFNSNSELITRYGDYKTYLAEQEKMFKATSSWDLYYEGKAQYEKATEQFNIANNIFGQYRKQKNVAEDKYNQLLAAYQEQQGEDYQISTSERASFASKAGYTTDLIRNVRDAEIAVDVALDARFNAVNTQRRGLYFNS